VPGTGGSPEYGMFGHPVYQRPALEGRLHWSWTETAQAFAGHIEGALAAAERTSTAILGDRLVSMEKSPRSGFN